jgi:hypothetical protein
MKRHKLQLNLLKFNKGIIKMKELLSIITLTAFILAPLSLNADQTELPADKKEKGLAIAKLADKADIGFENFTVKIKMVLTNKHGKQSTREMKTYTKEGVGDGDQTIIVFETPRDLRGSAVLTYTHKTKSDDQWLYLPALKRVKRIASENKSGSFMGSEFAYEDLASQEVEKYTYEYLKDEKLNGEDCYVINRFPVDKHSGYTKITTWIHKKRHTPEKMVYYDRKEALLKTLNFNSYKQYIDKFWRAAKFEMINHQRGKKTVLEWNGYKFKQTLKANMFTPNGMKKLR